MKKEYVVIPARQDTVDEFLRAISDQIDSKEAFKVTVSGLSGGSLPQKALLHIWVREYAAIYFRKHKKALTGDDETDIKVMMKQKAYKEYGWDFLTKKVTNHDLGISAHILKSIAEYSKGELYMFMEFVQAYCATQGVILESSGEYQNLKDQSMS